MPLVPDPKGFNSAKPLPNSSLAAEFGSAVAARAAEAHLVVEEFQRSLTSSIHVDGRSELDRLVALGLLPTPRTPF